MHGPVNGPYALLVVRSLPAQVDHMVDCLIEAVKSGELPTDLGNVLGNLSSICLHAAHILCQLLNNCSVRIRHRSTTG